MAECDNPLVERTLPTKTQWQIQAFVETCTAMLENYYGLTLPKNLFASPDASHISAATAYVADHALDNPDTQALMFLVDRGLSHIEQTNDAETPPSSLAVEVGTIIAAGASCSALAGVVAFARTFFNTTAGYQVLGRTTLADLGGGFGVGIMGGPEAAADEAAVSMAGETAPYLGIALGGSLLGDVLSRCSKRNTSSSSSGGGGSNPSQEKNPHDPPSKEPEPPVSGTLVLKALSFAHTPTIPAVSAIALAASAKNGKPRCAISTPEYTKDSPNIEPIAYIRTAIASKEISPGQPSTPENPSTGTETGVPTNNRVRVIARVEYIPGSDGVLTGTLMAAANGPFQDLSFYSCPVDFSSCLTQDITLSFQAKDLNHLKAGRHTTRITLALGQSTAEAQVPLHVINDMPKTPFSLNPAQINHLLTDPLLEAGSAVWELRQRSLKQPSPALLESFACTSDVLPGESIEESMARFTIPYFQANQIFEANTENQYIQLPAVPWNEATFDIDTFFEQKVATETTGKPSCGPVDVAFAQASIMRSQGFPALVCMVGAGLASSELNRALLVSAGKSFDGSAKTTSVLFPAYAAMARLLPPTAKTESVSKKIEATYLTKRLHVYDAYHATSYKKPDNTTGFRSLAGMAFAPDFTEISQGPQATHYYRDFIVTRGLHANPYGIPLATWKIAKIPKAASRTLLADDPVKIENGTLSLGARPLFTQAIKSRYFNTTCQPICHSLSYNYIVNTFLKAMNNNIRGDASAASRSGNMHTLETLINAVFITDKLAPEDKEFFPECSLLQDALSLLEEVKTHTGNYDYARGQNDALYRKEYRDYLLYLTNELLKSLNNAPYNLHLGSPYSCHWNPSVGASFDPREWIWVQADTNGSLELHSSWYSLIEAIDNDMAMEITKGIELPNLSHPKSAIILLNPLDWHRLKLIKSSSDLREHFSILTGVNQFYTEDNEPTEEQQAFLYSSDNCYRIPDEAPGIVYGKDAGGIYYYDDDIALWKTI